MGPLDISITAPEGPILELIDATLELYDVPWQLTPLKPVALDVRVTESAVQDAAGRYIEAARMNVDPLPDGLRATTTGGASIVGRFGAIGESWQMSVPRGQLVSADQWVDVEDLLSLVLTTGWRRAGWVPLHAAGLIEPGRQPGRQILVCAASGGGKTTFTVALVRRGWRSLGDDKLLVRGTEPGAIEAARTEARGSEARGNRSGTIVAAIKHMLNVDPAVSDWFPELALVRSLPAYSSRTPKRRLSLAGIWPHAPAASMEPTHLVVVNRIPGPGGVRPTPIDRAAAISALLRQTVIPRDPAVARQIARTIGQLAERVSAARFDMYDDAFEDEDAIGRALDRLQ